MKNVGLLPLTLLASLTVGCVAPTVPGLADFQAQVAQETLLVSFVATTLSWDTGGTIGIPGLTGATAGFSKYVSGPGDLFQFSFPLSTLLNGGKPFPESGLPDGRDLPGVSGGQLPRWDVTLGTLTLSLYLSDDAFGLFVPLSFVVNGVGLPAEISVQISDDRGNLVGMAYAVPVDTAGGGSGLFVLLPYLGGSPAPNS